jgi:hypothetical protein
MPFVFDTALTAKKYVFPTPIDRLSSAATWVVVGSSVVVVVVVVRGS